MANTIVSATEFNPVADVSYHKSKVNVSGGKNVGVLNKSTGKSVHLSTPLMLTWGVTEWVDEKSGRKSYDMNLQFPREDYSTPNTEKFWKYDCI